MIVFVPEIKSAIKTLGILDPFLEKKWIRIFLNVNLSQETIQQKQISSKFQFLAKVMVAKQFQNIFDLLST